MLSPSMSSSGADPDPAATGPGAAAAAPAPGSRDGGDGDDSSSSSLSTLPSLPSMSTLHQAPITAKDEDLGYDGGGGSGGGDDGLPRPSESEVYYFAYGVDFNPLRVREMLPDAVHLGLARLDGFRWLLCGPPRHDCMCTFPLFSHPPPTPSPVLSFF